MVWVWLTLPQQWVLDSPGAPPRLLKFRSGHPVAPSLLRYYGADGKVLLSAAQDRAVRMTSVVRDARSAELSQGPGLAKKSASLAVSAGSLKLPAVTALSFSATRARDWDDLLTAHKDEGFARSWSVANLRVGNHTFVFPETKGVAAGVVTAVCVSACGNFGACGSATGQVAIWSMQSGLLRKAFALPPSAAGKSRAVSGLASDALNTTLVVSTLDGTLTFFDFHTATQQSTLKLKSSADALALQRDSNLLAVVCGDRHVRIVDIETQRIVRELDCRARIRDIVRPLSLPLPHLLTFVGRLGRPTRAGSSPRATTARSARSTCPAAASSMCSARRTSQRPWP